MKVVFMGSSAASAECLHALLREDALDIVGVVTQPDRPVGRGKVLAPCPLARYAAEQGLADRIIKPENVNAEEPMATIRTWSPDVIAVVAYGQILKKPLLDLPLFGCINCHFSLLPKYRGAAPVVAALAAGYVKTNRALAATEREAASAAQSLAKVVADINRADSDKREAEITRALTAAEHLAARFPDNAEIADAVDRLKAARDAHARFLERRGGSMRLQHRFRRPVVRPTPRHEP